MVIYFGKIKTEANVWLIVTPDRENSFRGLFNTNIFSCLFHANWLEMGQSLSFFHQHTLCTFSISLSITPPHHHHSNSLFHPLLVTVSTLLTTHTLTHTVQKRHVWVGGRIMLTQPSSNREFKCQFTQNVYSNIKWYN